MTIAWANERRKLRDLIPWENNPREINTKEAQRLGDSLEEFGQIQTIAIGPDDEVYDGHQRKAVWSLLPQFGPDYEIDVRVSSRTLTDKERQKLVVYLHRGTAGTWDWDELANSFEVPELLEWGFEESELQLDWGKDATALGGKDATALGENEPDRAEYVPDALFPSDNEWGIPTLDVNLQADFLELPFARWGEIARTSKMMGTYHFYTDDYKFDALWSDPLNLVNSQCVAIIEANVSTNDQMPLAVGLWGVYRKRWLACYCQSFGIKVFVDLNVSSKMREINLLGVPAGWKAYATRSLDKDLDLVVEDYEIAKEHAGCDPLFVAYGGGKDSESLCKARGWLWLPENMHVKDGRRGNG